MSIKLVVTRAGIMAVTTAIGTAVGVAVQQGLLSDAIGTVAGLIVGIALVFEQNDLQDASTYAKKV